MICAAEEHPAHLALPRGCWGEVEVLLTEHGSRLDVEDRRNPGEAVGFNFKGTLTDLQRDGVTALRPHDLGVFVAPPGTGKTVLGAYIVALRGLNTLVLVHRKPLLDQWLAQLQAFLGLGAKEIGQIGGGKHKPNGRLDVAMIQSLAGREGVSDLIAAYGHVIVDECHHAPAVSFERVMKEVRARYILGLTATPHRRDGLQRLLHFQCGPILLTERREHLDLLAEALKDAAKHVVVLHGGVPAKARREAMKRLGEVPQDEPRLILATGRYIGEGFDDARLDTLFMAMPIAWKGTLIQYAGRLHRHHPGKHEVRVYDYLDALMPLFRRMFEKRLRGYRAMGYSMNETPGLPLLEVVSDP